MSDALHDFMPEPHSSCHDDTPEQFQSENREHAPGAVDFDYFIDMLPRLGTVLWLYRSGADTAFPRARITPRGVALFEHPALSALADCVSIDAFSTLTCRDGLREWMEFRDLQGNARAKLFLLPDTDYWAWDAMLGGHHCAPAQTAADTPDSARSHWACLRTALSALGNRDWHARVVRLPLLRLVGLRVVGLRGAAGFSRLSAEASGLIANDERAVWEK